MLTNNRIRDAVTDEDLELYCKVVNALMGLNALSIEMNRRNEGFAYNCHSICRALADCIPDLAVVDGYHFTVGIVVEGGFRPVIRQATIHSWLMTPGKAIIDPRPVSVMCMHPVFFPDQSKAAESYAATYLELAEVRQKIDMEEVARYAAILTQHIRDLL